jgi:CheY-like chemotaxis protein
VKPSAKSGAAPTLVRVVEDAIDQIALPDLRRELIVLALGRARESRMPRSGRKLLAFVSGPLYDVLAERFGADSAEVMLNYVAPVLNRAAHYELSGLRQRAASQGSASAGSKGGESGKGSGVKPVAQDSSSSSTREKSVGPTVLIIDSDSLFRAAVDRALTARGYRVLTAMNTHLALSMCLQRRPDLVLSDEDPPGSNVRQLAAVLRRTFRDQSPPVVLMTADPQPPEEGDEIARVVKKPVDPQVLLQILEPLIGSQSWASEPWASPSQDLVSQSSDDGPEASET